MTDSSRVLLIGWDVGGWNCDRNSLSRDALVVMDGQLAVLGEPWRGNLRAHINSAPDTDSFVASLLALCGLDAPLDCTVVFGIDTPLGFSSEFIDLLLEGRAVASIGNSAENPYLFRRTERFLFGQGLSPLSAVKDMIGSQASKGMHVLAKFIPQVQSCGVWSDCNRVSAIEVYPSSAKRSSSLEELRSCCLDRSSIDLSQWHDDERDALTCALITWMYHFHPEQVAHPSLDIPIREGWIFVPLDGLG